jgi:iron complex outermembrane recepter protein
MRADSTPTSPAAGEGQAALGAPTYVHTQVKTHRISHVRLLFCLAPLALASAAPAQTPPATADEPLQLPEFTVSSEKADAYRATQAMSLARIGGAILDTPVSINVISRGLIDDLGANSTFDAARYMAGIGAGRGAGTNGGINDRMNFRGFESFTRTVDNFSSTFIPGNSTSIDTFEPEFIDRVEIVMGPDAILNPTGTPGGSMNVVTKSPLFTQQGYLKAIVGNYSAQKFAFDFTGPLPLLGGKKLAYRIMGSGQDTTTYIPGKFQKYDIGAELAYQISDTSKLTFKYFGLDYKAYANASAPNDNGWLVYEPTSIGGATLANTPQTPGVAYNGTNGVDTNSITVERTNQLQLLYTGTIAHLISMRLGGQLLSHNNVGDSAYPASASGSSTFDPATGQVTAAPSFNPASVPEVWRYNKNLGVMHQFQNDYAANLHPGPVSLQLVAGWAYQHNHNYPTRTGTATLPAANLFAGDYTVPRPDINTFTFSNRSKSQATQKQAYALAKAGFLSDRVFLTAGATRTWVSSQSYTMDKNTLAVLGVNALSGQRDNYIGSILAKPTKNTSVYYTYSTNATLTTYNPGNGVSVPLWSVGKQHEFGFKSEFFDQRLSFTATHFQISQTNVTSPNPLANINPQAAGNILTDNTSRGYEFNLVGGITKNLSTITSYTDMKYRDAFGRPVRNVPDRMANALLNYHFTSGMLNRLSVFGGVTYFGRVPGETITGLAPAVAGQPRVPALPGFYVAAWHVFNAGVSYGWDRWVINLNAENVFDQRFAWEPASRLSVSPYPSTAVRLTTTLKF